MSYTFKLARRTARLRVLAVASLALTVFACNADETTGPLSDIDTPIEAPITANSDTAGVTPSLYTSSTAPGIPFGDFHLPTSLFSSSRYSGSLQALWPSGVYTVLNAARNAGERVVISLAGNRGYYTNSDGTFNMSKWKYRISLFKKYNLNQYVTSGTVIGHYLVDEPYCSGCWGGRKITYSQIEEMARYSRSIWSGLPTGVRSSPSQLGTTSFRYLDFAWAQWGGPLHTPSYKMTPEQFRDREVSRAKTLGLGLLFGMNYLDGGDGSSHINGTYAKDPNPWDSVRCTSKGCYRYAMSASEVKRVGAVFAGASYACGLVSWKYSSTFLSYSGVKNALDYVSGLARNRSRSSCKK